MIAKRIISAITGIAVLTLCGCNSSGSSSKSASDESSKTVSVSCSKLIVDKEEVVLTDEMNDTISKYYSEADTEKEYFLDSAFMENEVVYMDDGAVLTVDNNVTNHALFQKGKEEKIISLEDEFYSYLKSLGEK